MQEIISKKNIGERLRSLRLAKDLSQAEVSEVFGLSRSHYSQVELGKQFPSYSVLSRVAEFYNRDYEWLLHGENVATIISNVKVALNAEARRPLHPESGLIEMPRITSAVPTSRIIMVSSNEYISYLQNRTDEGYLSKLHEMSLPLAQLGPGSCRGFEVCGDEMEMTLSGQDIVIASLVEDHLKVAFSGVYVFVTESYVKIARVNGFNPLNGVYTCVLDNSKYAVEMINIAEVQELWEVKAKISFKFTQTIQSVARYFTDLESSVQHLKTEVQRLQANLD